MSLFDDLSYSRVAELSLREALSTLPGGTVQDAVTQMRAKNLGCLFIVDEEGRLLGMFTEAMLRSLLARSPDALLEPLTTQMAERVPRVNLADPVDLVLTAMDQKNTRFLAVVDAQERLLHLTGQKGLMEYIAEYYPYEVFVQTLDDQIFQNREGA